MFFGVKIAHGLEDWQVLQRHRGEARVQLVGTWALEAGAQGTGVKSHVVQVRCFREIDNSLVFNWTSAQTNENGTWSCNITLPEGGPFRVETTLKVEPKRGEDIWLFRGDIRVHIGVGDIFCIAGQSNAAGYGTGVAYDPPHPMVRIKRNSGRWDMATHPFNDATDASDCLNAPMGICGTGPFLTFARQYAAIHGVPVGLLIAAQGGQPLSRWDPQAQGDLLSNTVDKINQAGGCAAILWYQGCSDAVPDLAQSYLSGFSRVVNAVRHSLGWNIPFFTFQLNRYIGCTLNLQWGIVKEAQRVAADEMDGVYLMPTNGVPLSDSIHNSSDGNVLLGERLEKQVSSVLYGSADFQAPKPVHCVARGNIITIFTRNSHGDLRMTEPDSCFLNFSVKDQEGNAPVVSVEVQETCVHIMTERRVIDGARVSYAYSCEPAEGIVEDKVTRLPLVSFCDLEVEL